MSETAVRAARGRGYPCHNGREIASFSRGFRALDRSGWGRQCPPVRMTVLVRLAYDGTDFHGFARQAGGGREAPLRTVQGELEAALAQQASNPISRRHNVWITRHLRM